VTLRAECGTVDGWKRHQQQGSIACEGCTAAREKYLENVGQMRNGRVPRRVQRERRAQTALLTPRPASCGLSEREWQVAVLAIRGLGNGDTATELGISVDTVKTHMRSILDKLEIANRTHLAILAYRRGWLPADLVEEGEHIAVPRELFLALTRISHLVQYGRGAEARALAQRVAPQLPRPRTHAPDQNGG